MSTRLRSDDPAARELRSAIDAGDVDALDALLTARPELAGAVVVDAHGHGRSALHLAVDAPGHRPRTAAVIARLAAGGADPGARFEGPHTETPLHWAASNDDVEAIDALLAAGADRDAGGAVIAGGPPLEDAVAFGQWAAARHLVALGAEPSLHEAAALGLADAVQARLDARRRPSRRVLTEALWYACHGGQLAIAQALAARGGDPAWQGFGGQTPQDAARAAGADDVVAWLRSR